jgi:hypothetical protein
MAASVPPGRPARTPARRRIQPGAGRVHHALSGAPNPIGLHRVRILAIDQLRIQVGSLEALDGTPIVDIKPVIAFDDSGATGATP